jgi:hypothetical protein
MGSSLLQFGGRRERLINLPGVFEGEGADGADFDAFSAIGAS